MFGIRLKISRVVDVDGMQEHQRGDQQKMMDDD
jgi:hypothetical protein